MRGRDAPPFPQPKATPNSCEQTTLRPTSQTPSNSPVTIGARALRRLFVQQPSARSHPLPPVSPPPSPRSEIRERATGASREWGTEAREQQSSSPLCQPYLVRCVATRTGESPTIRPSANVSAAAILSFQLNKRRALVRIRARLLKWERRCPASVRHDGRFPQTIQHQPHPFPAMSTNRAQEPRKSALRCSPASTFLRSTFQTALN
ncbi:hypothetical protein IWZ00DRAFT_570907 [Phyllosticta capitalensis]